jgi:PAS domain S-box-containing protein
MNNWVKGVPVGITVCDKDGVLLDMNDAAINIFATDGGRDLIGKNILDCHPEPSRSKLAGMLKEQKTNTYTIEKKGKKKIIHQTPWYENGEYKGFVEISFELPVDMAHFKRPS